MTTLNALRRFLRDSGCVEERSFELAGGDTLYLELVCKLKVGKACRAILAVDPKGGWLPDAVLIGLQKKLAPCLGRGWLKRIPGEDPFG